MYEKCSVVPFYFEQKSGEILHYTWQCLSSTCNERAAVYFRKQDCWPDRKEFRCRVHEGNEGNSITREVTPGWRKLGSTTCNHELNNWYAVLNVVIATESKRWVR